MLNLYKLITDELKELLPNQKQFLDLTIDKPDKPLVTFNIPNSLEPFQYRSDYLVEFHVWGKYKDLKTLEDLVEDIDEIFNRLHYLDSNMRVDSYRATPYKLQLPDPDKELKHYKLQYIFQTYELKG
jgi:hypothetical protein